MQLVGRDLELDAGRRAIAEVADGKGRSLVVIGEGGIGKTRLIEELAGYAARAGVAWFAAEADISERAVALGPVHRALRLGPHVGQDAVLDALEERAVARPTIVCIEDLHHADEDTLRCLREAMQRFATYAFGVVVTTRPPQAQPAISALIDLAERVGSQIVDLEALSTDAVRDLTDEMIGAPAGRSIIDQVERANGNPLYVTELLGALVDSGSISVVDDRAELSEAILPPSMARTILRRVAVLPPETVETLRTAAILGPTFSVADLQTVTERSAIDIAAALDPALSSGFVRGDGQRLAFRHDLVHEAIYTDVPEAVRRSIHLEMATRLRAAGRSAAGIAHHVLAGATADAPGAVDLIVAVEQELLADVPLSVNVALLERAIAITEPWDVRNIAARVKLLNYMPGRGRYAELVAEARALLLTPLPDDLAPAVRAHLASGLLATGEFAEAEDLLASVAADPAASAQSRIEADTLLAVIALHTGRIEVSEVRARSVLAIDESAPGEHTGAWMVLCNAASIQGALGEAVTLGARAVESAERALAIGQGPASPGRSAAYALAAVDRFDEALRLLERLRERYEPIEGRTAGGHLVGEADLMYALGRWDEALVQAEAALGAGHESGVPARIALHRGDAAGAQAWLDRLRADQSDRSISWVRALLALEQGRMDDALELLESGFRDPTVRFFFGSWRQRWPDLLKVAKSTGHDEIVPDVVEAARSALAHGSGEGSVEAAVARIEGIATSDTVRLTAAAAALSRTPRIVESAGALEDVGDADHLRAALDIWDELGATADADRVRAKLRGLGIRTRAPASRGRPTTGWDALTDRELRVVELVAAGLTNVAVGEQLYISKRTVAAHLRSVFDKLAIASRAELAAAAVRRSG